MSNIDAVEALMAEYGTTDAELEDWELPWLDVKVALEDGRRFKVHADQRDQQAGLDTLGIDRPGRDTAIAYAAAVSWAHLTRKGRIAMDWPTFNDACAFVDVGVKAVDPTEAVGGPSSAP